MGEPEFRLEIGDLVRMVGRSLLLLVVDFPAADLITVAWPSGAEAVCHKSMLVFAYRLIR